MIREASVKTGDTGRVLEAHLRYDDGTPIDLTGCTVRFRMRREGATYADVDGDAEVVAPPSSGVVRFSDWDPADLDEPGTYQCEWLVTDSDGLEVTAPSDSYLVLRIRQGIEVAPNP
jgi:hypothetical protein